MSSESASPDEHMFVTGAMWVRELVGDVIAEVASEELSVVEGLAGFDDATIVKRLGRRGRRREPLGFGVGEVVALVTPVVWLAVDQAAKKVAGSAVDGAARGAKAVMLKVLRKRSAPAAIPPLTAEQLGEVRRRVLEVAAGRGLGKEHAMVIADAVVTRLVLAAPEDPCGGLGGPDSPGDVSPVQG